ncbi:MAG TPA: hypothetical protein VK179_02185 [Bacteroidales bacterium]|nr:hypothetical protein [Bacteroidales bacterium]
MKKMLFLCLIAIPAVSCTTQNTQIKTDLEAANLKGKVKSLTKTIHNNQGSICCPFADIMECRQTAMTYDEQGNVTESSLFDGNGDITMVSKYCYNQNGQCREIDKFIGGTEAGKEQYVFAGNKVSKVKVLDEKGKKQAIYKNRYNGNDLAETITLNADGDVVGSVTYEISNGQVISETKKDGKGNIEAVRRFKRNDNNDVIEAKIILPASNKEFRFVYEYEYDEAGNWIQQTQLLDGNISRVTVRNISYYKS